MFGLPSWFESSRLKLATETFDGMLSLDDKNYVIFDGSKLIKHGSGIKGRAMPIVCDQFIDNLCWALFEGRAPIEVYQQYRDLSRFPSSDFYFNINLGKRNYKSGTLYSKIANKADVNASLFILKTPDGYELNGEPDHDYYKQRLSKIAQRITGQKAKFVRRFLGGQLNLEAFSEKIEGGK